MYKGQTVTFDMDASWDGHRAVFALGDSANSTPAFAMVGVDASVVGTPTGSLAGGGLDCLQVVSTESAATLSFVTRESESEILWRLRELDAEGQVAFEASEPLPLADDTGFTGCPVVVEVPIGYAGAWTSLDGQGAIVTVTRAADIGAPPLLLELPEGVPGMLSGAIDEDFLLVHQAADETRSVTRLTRDGELTGTTYPFPGIVDFPDVPRVLRVQGNSFLLTYVTESARVIEQIECP